MHDDPISSSGYDRLARIDITVYGMEAVLKSAYRFTDKCYLHLQRDGENIVQLRMRPKRADEDPDAAIRDFLNDLIDQRLRSIVAAETAGVRDLIMAHALSRTTLIRADFETAEPVTDPHHVSVPDRPRASAT